MHADGENWDISGMIFPFLEDNVAVRNINLFLCQKQTTLVTATRTCVHEPAPLP